MLKRSTSHISFYILSLSLLISELGFADIAPMVHHPAEAQKKLPPDLPWLTGPLLTPSGHVVPAGHWNFEPYLFVTTTYGQYDSKWNSHSTPNFYNLNVQVPIQYGIVNPIDMQIVPQFSWNHTDGASEWVLNDLPIILDIQLLSDKPHKWWPAIKLTFEVSAPIGKYQHLSASKLGTDAGGDGSWDPTAALVFSRLFHFKEAHFLAPRLYFGYTVPNPVHVKNLNFYGGAKGTRGKVYPGNTFITLLGLEYSLSANWALACDFEYIHQNKTRFSGKTIVPVTSPSSEQFSIAPAFEYNWSANVGLIAGAWFSFAGRNSSDFASGIIAVNIYK